MRELGVERGGEVGALRVEHWMTRRLLEVGPDEPARSAVEALLEGGVRHLVVRDGGAAVGILSNRDVIRVTLANQGRVLDIDGCLVRDIMTPAPLVTTTPAATLADVASKLRREGIGALPVCEGEEIVGIITSDDVLAAVAGERRTAT